MVSAMDIPAHCFLIVHPGKPDHGPVICGDEAWPGFSAGGWVRMVAEPQDAPPAPVVDAEPSPVEAPAAPAPVVASKARKTKAPAPAPAPVPQVKDTHGAFG